MHHSPSISTRRRFLAGYLGILASLGLAAISHAAELHLLNSSYDVTREFYKNVNELFTAHCKSKVEADVVIDQSHGGSSKQARAVLDGLEADVVTFNQSTDVDLLVPDGLVAANWREAFPHQASPYTSTILFLVRKGNPKGIKDWSDLVREGAQVIIPNPKTSGNGRYSYLGAWAYALQQSGGDESKAKDFVKKLFGNVPVLDTGGRGATNSFVQNGIGDVLLTFENEVHLIINEFGADKFEVVVPALSVFADAPIAVVDSVAKKHGTTEVAKEYLTFLFTDPVQEVAAKQYFRPSNPGILQKYAAQFPTLKQVTVEEILGGWKKAYEVHFKDGGVFDEIYAK